MTLNLREKILVFLLGIVVVLFVGIKLLITPALATLSLHTQTLLDMQTRQNIARMNLATASKLDNTVKKAASAADAAAANILPSVDNERLNLWLLGLTSANGLTVNSIKFATPVVTEIGQTATNQQSSGSSSQVTTVNTLTYLLKTYAEGFKGHTVSSGTVGSSTASKSTSAATQSSSAAQTAKSTAGTAANTASTGTSTSTAGSLLSEDVTLQLSGNYGGFKAFLDTIKNSGKTVQVTKLDITPQNATVVLRCYGAEKPDDTDTVFAWTLPAPAGKNDIM